MNTQPTFPDYRIIVDELIKGCRSEDSDLAMNLKVMLERRSSRIAGSQVLANYVRSEVLRNYRTIRFGTARCTGGAEWMMEHLASNVGDTVIFTKDKYVADSLLQVWTEHTSGDTTIELLRAVNDRVLPQYVVRQSPGHPPPEVFLSAHKAPKYIIVSEASNHLHFFAKELYYWIAETAEPDPIIILVG